MMTDPTDQQYWELGLEFATTAEGNTWRKDRLRVISLTGGPMMTGMLWDSPDGMDTDSVADVDVIDMSDLFVVVSL